MFMSFVQCMVVQMIEWPKCMVVVVVYVLVYNHWVKFCVCWDLNLLRVCNEKLIWEVWWFSVSSFTFFARYFGLIFFYVMLGCQGVVKLVFQGNPNVYSLFVQQIENPRFRFDSPLIWLNSFNCSYGRQRTNPYDLKPLPEGVPRSMCFYGDPCKVDISEDEKTYRQRYWMCPNYAWEPTKQQRRASFVRNFYCVLINFLVILSIAYLFVL